MSLRQTGVILAGGNGTRLRPLTLIANKHLLPVYDKVMIEYPLKTLTDLGCTDILIVSGGEHIGGFAEYLGDGSRYGVRLTYRVQPDAGGIAQALLCAEGFTDSHQTFPVILGDNYLESRPFIAPTPCIFVKKVTDANRFGVYDPIKNEIVEKPKGVTTGQAVIGFYVYDYRVYDFIKTLQPSARGEMEITDVNNWYLKQDMVVHEYKSEWLDMGTYDSLLRAANFIKQRHHQLT